MSAEPQPNRVLTIEEAENEAFDAMMTALSQFFHVTICADHTEDERGAAYVSARKAFIEYAYDGVDPDEATIEAALGVKGGEGVIGSGNHETRLKSMKLPNAPTSNKVH